MAKANTLSRQHRSLCATEAKSELHDFVRALARQAAAEHFARTEITNSNAPD